MRRWIAAIATIVLLVGCGESPTRPGSETIERARDIAEQLEERNAELEDEGASG